MKEHIYVGFPCAALVTPGVAWLNGVLQKLSVDPKCRFSFETNFKIGRRPVDYARNCITHDFLKSDASKLWFIDSDILPPDNCVRVLLPDVDIVGGLYPAFGQSGEGPVHAHYTFYMQHESGAYVPAERHEEGLHRCDAIGTGMMAIKRHVLEDPRMWYEPTYTRFNGRTDTIGPDDAPPVFRNRHKPNGEFDATEDLDFCFRAKSLGYEVAADHEVICGHWKDVNVEHVINHSTDAWTKGFMAAAEKYTERPLVELVH